MKHIHACGAIIYCTTTNRILMQLRSHTCNFPLTWSLWGGKIEEGERPFQALQRELKEERKIRPNGYQDFDKGKSWEQIYQESYDYYKSHSKMLSFFREKHNRDFWNNLQLNQN